ncbi:MAG: GNAT family N-acetyltransferase [Chloroflexi bacterium]|nr:GNAT family N-acetyltransferase [Chloroflexota bacterium]
MRSIAVDSALRLRDPLISDAEHLFGLVDSNREHLGRWLPWISQVRTVADERAWIQGRLAPGASEAELALMVLENGTIVGALGISGLGSPGRACEIGYWLAKSAEGRGVMTRSCRAALKYCFEARSMNRVQIRAAVDNIRSRAIPERLGFTFEGVQRQAALVNGKYQDLAVYSLLASEWNAEKNAPAPYVRGG